MIHIRTALRAPSLFLVSCLLGFWRDEKGGCYQPLASLLPEFDFSFFNQSDVTFPSDDLGINNALLNITTGKEYQTWSF